MRSWSVGFISVGMALGMLGCRGCESSSPPVHLIRNMDTQEKGKAFRHDTSGLFQDGREMREPVEGTVALGQLEEDARLYEGLDEQGKPTKTFPDAVKTDGVLSDELRARGKLRFDIYCAPCHGVAGDGKGPVAGVALDGGPRLIVPPPAFSSDRLKGMVVGQMYAAIRSGVNAGNMPSYSAQIEVKDRWAVLAYVRKLQREADPTITDEGGEIMAVAKQSIASAEYGAQLYKAKTCNACHTIDGNKLVGPTFKGLYGKTESTSAGDVVVDDEYLKESMLNPMAKIVTGFPPAMPPLPLDDIEVKSLSLYIATLK
jgi:mono/diheme cytochrome c family protein